jgi:hypothetical protein
VPCLIVEEDGRAPMSFSTCFEPWLMVTSSLCKFHHTPTPHITALDRIHGRWILVSAGFARPAGFWIGARSRGTLQGVDCGLSTRLICAAGISRRTEPR